MERRIRATLRPPPKPWSFEPMMLGPTLVALAVATPAAAAAVLPFTDRRVEVAPGRSLRLRCAGAGPVTVLFDAGGSDWSIIWAGVQREIARKAQACAYDRAGLGMSDPARGPRTPA